MSRLRFRNLSHVRNRRWRISISSRFVHGDWHREWRIWNSGSSLYSDLRYESICAQERKFPSCQVIKFLIQHSTQNTTRIALHFFVFMSDLRLKRREIGDHWKLKVAEKIKDDCLDCSEVSEERDGRRSDDAERELCVELFCLCSKLVIELVARWPDDSDFDIFDLPLKFNLFWLRPRALLRFALWPNSELSWI